MSVGSRNFCFSSGRILLSAETEAMLLTLMILPSVRRRGRNALMVSSVPCETKIGEETSSRGGWRQSSSLTRRSRGDQRKFTS